MSTDDPNAYEVRVRGHLDDHWACWLGGVTITRHDDGTSTLTALSSDQARLHGLLTHLRDVGIELLSVNPAEADLDLPGSAHARPCEPGA